MAYVHTGGGGSPAIQTAYSQTALYPFKNNLVFGNAAQEKVWSEEDGDPMPGKAVTFTFLQHLSNKTTTLSETGDPTTVDISLAQKSITLYEYGSLMTRTSKFKATTFLQVDTNLAYLIAYNAASSLDLIARAAFDAEAGATWNHYGSGSAVASVYKTNVLTWANVRQMKNKLERENVPPPRMLNSGEMLHGAVIHPDTLYDLRTATGSGNWRYPKEYVDASELMTGEMGAWEGFYFQVTNHARVQISSGASSGTSADVYTSYFYGLEAVGKANGNVGSYVEDDGTNGEFTVVISGPFDGLRRLRNIGWKSLCGYGALRRSSLHKYHHGSSRETHSAQSENATV
jgi:N4-gp56 family major capsid protein